MKTIRPTVQAIIRDGDKVLIFKGYDSTKNIYLYRCLGGTIVFGEKSEEALKRHMKDKLGTDITNVKFVKPIEAVFTYRSEEYHEIVFVYECKLAKKSIYGAAEVDYKGEKHSSAIWMDIKTLKKSRLVPEEIKELI